MNDTSSLNGVENYGLFSPIAASMFENIQIIPRACFRV